MTLSDHRAQVIQDLEDAGLQLTDAEIDKEARRRAAVLANLDPSIEETLYDAC